MEFTYSFSELWNSGDSDVSDPWSPFGVFTFRTLGNPKLLKSVPIFCDIELTKIPEFPDGVLLIRILKLPDSHKPYQNFGIPKIRNFGYWILWFRNFVVHNYRIPFQNFGILGSRKSWSRAGIQWFRVPWNLCKNYGIPEFMEYIPDFRECVPGCKNYGFWSALSLVSVLWFRNSRFPNCILGFRIYSRSPTFTFIQESRIPEITEFVCRSLFGDSGTPVSRNLKTQALRNSQSTNRESEIKIRNSRRSFLAGLRDSRILELPIIRNS